MSACFSTWIYMSLISLKSVSAWRGIRWLKYVFSVRIVITPYYCYNCINYIHLKWCITIVELSNWFTSRLLHKFTVHALKPVKSSLDKLHLSHYQILDEIFWWKKIPLQKIQCILNLILKSNISLKIIYINIHLFPIGMVLIHRRAIFRI